jgi:phenylacetate-CoA ligase
MRAPVPGNARVIAAFHRAAREMPWYRELLAAAAVDPSEIVDLATFVTRVPLLTKNNTFHRFPIDHLAAGTRIADLAGVLTSSGHGGRFAFGLTTRTDAAMEEEFIDDALDATFAVRSRRTLLINCLPMGVVFRSAATTVATVSVREDMALALLVAFGHHFEQVVIVADPLFVKRVIDYAAENHYDWSRVRTHVILGEEIFGEHFRTYVANALRLNIDGADSGSVMSSFGVGELGLHLAHETPATIALRRAAWTDAALARELLAHDSGCSSLPAILAFNPSRTLVEVLAADSSGYGQLAFSLLDPGAPIPLLRYSTGDVARILDADSVMSVCARRGTSVSSGLPAQMIALRGRVGDRLPNGADVGLYKDVLYADPMAAPQLSGAFRLIVAADSLTWHVQRALSNAADPMTESELISRLLQHMPTAARPGTIIIWEYEQFPFGMGLDYQRKFAYRER